MNVKNISFIDKHTKNKNFGINFEVEVTQRIIIHISQEALQDIESENRCDSVEEQFKSNRIKFEEIAKEKIYSMNNSIHINSDDVCK
ncbi:DUF1488 family protein [Acinetobacter sp. YH12218]|uniref:DUF1488 family protein n=1 Tax=Acinetobacter sp. YH12218 TaxID=2601152 RepID=UPI0015D3A0D0|nr:DUF1488 family protein [Acinetobacter sp. YH12218]